MQKHVFSLGDIDANLVTQFADRWPNLHITHTLNKSDLYLIKIEFISSKILKCVSLQKKTLTKKLAKEYKYFSGLN